MKWTGCMGLLVVLVAGCGDAPKRVVTYPDGRVDERVDPVKAVELFLEYGKARGALELKRDDPSTDPQEALLIGRQLDAMDNTVVVAVETAVGEAVRLALVYESGLEVRYNRDGFMVRLADGVDREALLREWRAGLPLQNGAAPPSKIVTTHPRGRVKGEE